MQAKYKLYKDGGTSATTEPSPVWIQHKNMFWNEVLLLSSAGVCNPKHCKTLDAVGCLFSKEQLQAINTCIAENKTGPYTGSRGIFPFKTNFDK